MLVNQTESESLTLMEKEIHVNIAKDFLFKSINELRFDIIWQFLILVSRINDLRLLLLLSNDLISYRLWVLMRYRTCHRCVIFGMIISEIISHFQIFNG